MNNIVFNMDYKTTKGAYKKGDTAEVSPEIARVYIAHGIATMGDISLDDLKVPQLKEIAEEKGINVDGMKKAEIIEAIRQ